MPDVMPHALPGVSRTCHASAAITGGRFVAISGEPVDGNPRVALAGAGAAVYGIAAQDAAIGEKVLVYVGPGVVVPVEAPGALAAGAIVQSDATGRAVAVGAAPNLAAGRLEAAVAAGAFGRVQLNPQLVR